MLNVFQLFLQADLFHNQLIGLKLGHIFFRYSEWHEVAKFDFLPEQFLILNTVGCSAMMLGCLYQI